MNLIEIMKKSPDCPGYGGNKWAIYSVGCCWWTSFPEDMGNTQKQLGYPNGMIIKNRNGSETETINSPGLPCCPHCGSMLMQAPLKKFIDSAEKQEKHYDGIENFTKAHSRNSNTCHGKWKHYKEDE